MTKKRKPKGLCRLTEWEYQRMQAPCKLGRMTEDEYNAMWEEEHEETMERAEERNAVEATCEVDRKRTP